MSQVGNIKPETETQDVAMDDATPPPAAEKPRINLEELFEDDDDDSDSEFASSASAAKSEGEESSQPAPLYVPSDTTECRKVTDVWQ